MGLVLASAIGCLALAAIPGGLGNASPLSSLRVGPGSTPPTLSLNVTLGCFTGSNNPGCSSTWFPGSAAATVSACYVAGARVEGCNVTVTWNASRIGSYVVIESAQTSVGSASGPSLSYFLTGSDPALPAYLPGAHLSGTDAATLTCWFHLNRLSGPISGTLHLFLE